MDSFKTKTHIIAEMACSHEGNPALARTIIDGAGKAGADAIQFQVWSLPDMVVPHHPDWPILEKIELSPDQWRELSVYSRKNYPKMQIIACVYELKSVAFAQSINVDAFKIHSADLSNPILIKHISRTGKRIDLSVGASTLLEIQQAIEWIKEASSKTPVWLMYGYQSFPTPTDAINLDYMMQICELFGLPIGYQDHSDADAAAAFWLPAAAVGAGANIIEKHITHDRSYKGIDHQSALNPDEFLKFVEMVREIETAKGCSHPQPFNEEEIKYRKYSKKSLVAATDLKAGKTVKNNDLLFMRADRLGVPPDQADRLTGRTLKKTILKYHCIDKEDTK
jgi:N,N'-diacetyllegionaminate synthase